MVVLLVLLTCVVLLTVDWAVRRFGAAAPEASVVPAPDPVPVPRPVFVAGYQLPDDLHYHRGHTWARVVSPDTVVVGIDDFGRRLTGRADAVTLPVAGTHLVQGGPAARLGRRSRDVTLTAPVGGEVVAVNRALAHNPSLATDDPYGRGWLFKVRNSALATHLRNLMDGTLARRWTEDARSELELRLMALSGSVLQDGGEPAPDFADHLDDDAWRQLASHFLLSETEGGRR